jgi:hypothetical protein
VGSFRGPSPGRPATSEMRRFRPFIRAVGKRPGSTLLGHSASHSEPTGSTEIGGAGWKPNSQGTGKRANVFGTPHLNLKYLEGVPATLGIFFTEYYESQFY